MATVRVRIDKTLFDKAAIMAKVSNRTTSKQIELWVKIGEMMEDNPDLSYQFVKQVIIAEAEKESGKLEAFKFSEKELLKDLNEHTAHADELASLSGKKLDE